MAERQKKPAPAAKGEKKAAASAAEQKTTYRRVDTAEGEARRVVEPPTGAIYAAKLRAEQQRQEAEQAAAAPVEALAEVPLPDVEPEQAKDAAEEPAAQPSIAESEPAVQPPKPGKAAAARKKRAPLPAPLHALGGLLYTLGFAGEYWFIKAWRFVREFGIVLGQFLAWFGTRLGRAFAALFRSIGHEIAAPFVRFARRTRQLRRLRERARKRGGEVPAVPYRGAALKNSLSLFGTIVGAVLPVVAVVALCFTVYNVLSTEYALAVEINGQAVGYVTDKSVVENAKTLLRDRIRLAPNQAVADWQLNPDYSLAKAEKFTTAQQLVNEILLHSTDDPTDLVAATGLYIDDRLYAVTTEGEALKAYLDKLLETYEGSAGAGATVSFVKDVECEPNEDDLFFASAVGDYDELLEALTEVVAEEVTFEADGEQTLSDIAYAHNITLEMLIARNPGYAEEESDFVPEAGEELLIQREKTFLQVQTSYRQKSVEIIPYVTEETETNERPKGAVVTVQEGADGSQEVWDDYVYIDGELDRRVRVDELTVVLEEPVKELIEIGTKVTTIAPGDVVMPAGGYGGSFIFPVPTSPYSSRGMGAGHRGMDINDAEGMPIYACEGGVVTTAGWHWSWGNYIVIQHPNNVTTLYAHCSALFVSAGDTVGQGAHIAAVGNTGYSFGSHLHLEITVNGALVDPVSFVGYPY